MTAERRANKVLGIDWDSRMLRAVVAHLSKRGVKIDRLLSVKIPSEVEVSDPEQMGQHIRRVLDQEEITIRHALVDMPREQAVLNTLSLPVGSPDELPGIVEIQVGKELPFPVGDAAIDFVVGPSNADSPTSEILVAAVRREVLHQYEATFAAAGLKLDRVGLRPSANKMAICSLLRHAMPQRVLMIDVRPTLTEIDVVCDGFLAFSRAASVVVDGSEEFAAAPPPTDVGGLSDAVVGLGIVPTPEGQGAAQATAVRSLMVEVTRSIEAYRATDPGAQIDHVVVAGDVGVEAALAEAIQQRLDLTTELYNPASTFGWEPDEGADASAFAAALGLVLGHADDSDGHFDFLHPKRIVSQAQERLKKAPVLAVVVGLFVVAGAVGFSAYTKPDRDKLAGIESAIEAMKENSKENKKFLKLVEAIDTFDVDQHVWVDVLYDAAAQLPSNETLVLDHIELKQKEGRIVFKTRAKTREAAGEAIGRLVRFQREGREGPRFKAIMGTQQEKAGDRYPFTQDIKIEIKRDRAKRTVATDRK